MKAIKKVTVLLLLTITSTFAQEVTTSKFGKGLLNITGKDSTFYMNFSARMQYLSATSWSEGDFENRESNFLVRRSRLKFSGFAYNPKLTYKLELGLSNRDISGASAFTSNAPRYILDAYIRWNFYKNFTLQAGQGKLPGNIERVISSGNLALVDRSLLNSKFNIDRDLGIQFRHHFKLSENFIVKEIFAISQGEGRNITKGNLGGHQYTSRIEVLPFGKFKHAIERCSAVVPLDTLTAYFVLLNFAKFLSSKSILFEYVPDISPFLIVSHAALISFFFKIGLKTGIIFFYFFIFTSTLSNFAP